MSRQMWKLLRISVSAVLTFSTVVVGGPVLAASDEPPGPPTNIVLAKAGPGAVKVTWDTPKETGSGPILSQTATAYRKGLIDSKGAWWEKSSGECRVTATRGRVSCTIRNLPNGTYNIRVLAWTSAGNNTTILSDPLITIQPNPAVGVACVSKGEVTQVKGKYLECGPTRRWRSVTTRGSCVMRGMTAGLLRCDPAGKGFRWVRINSTNCGYTSSEPAIALIQCGDLAMKETSSRYPTLIFHFDPKVPEKVQNHLQRVGAKYLPLYSKFFDSISTKAQIHVLLSLTPSWCAKESLKTDDGSETFLLENYCQQDGGANGGHGSMRYDEYGSIILRPHTSEVDAIMQGDLSSDMLTEIFIAELGHASRDVGSDSWTGSRGIAKWVPAWLAYVPNQFGWFYSGTVEGFGPDDYQLATWGERNLAWRPTVTDRRFLPQNLGGELGDMDRPSLYNVAYLASRMLVLKHGLGDVIGGLIRTLIVSDGDYDRSARTLGYADWADLERAVDAYLLDYYEAENIVVPSS